jgi:signal transduction histidine kinase
VGIPADQLERIFEPGFTTKGGVQVGTGLGLSICYNVMQDHDGSIEVVSEEGQGAEVTLTLPIRMRNQTGPLPLLRDLAI